LAIKHGADRIFFGYYLAEKDGLRKPVHGKEKRKTGRVTQWEAINLLLFDVIGNAAWNKLYMKKIFAMVSYPDRYLYEDVGTTYKTILLADTIYYLNKEIYYHCYHHGSITTLRTEKAIRDWFAMHMQQYHDLAAWGYPEDKLKRLLQNIALSYCIRRKADWQDANYVFCFKTLQVAHHIPEHFTWKRKILFVILKYCPPVFDLVCNLWGKRWHCSE